jgi:hypothetical protein
MKVRALISEAAITMDKIYESTRPDTGGDVIVVDDDGELYTLYEGFYEPIVFEPGTEDYFIKIKDEAHFKYVKSLVENVGYKWVFDDTYYSSILGGETQYLILTSIKEVARTLGRPDGSIEITTDDLVWCEKSEPTAEEVVQAYLDQAQSTEPFADEIILHLQDAGFTIERQA